MILASRARRRPTHPHRRENHGWASPTQLCLFAGSAGPSPGQADCSILAFLAVVIVVLGAGLCGFLAITNPVGGQVVVVEGWMPTYAYREAAALFRKGRYQKIIVAGESNEDEGADLELPERSGGEKLIYFGVPSELVVAVSSGEANPIERFILQRR